MTSRAWRVVGSTGFVGSAVTRQLRAQGHTVQAVSAPRLSSGARTVHHLLGRAKDLESVIDYLADSFAGADVVVNAAGIATPDGTDQDALVGANAMLPVLILAAAERTGVKRVVHISSAAVQGKTPYLDESARTSPFSPYSFSKALGESALQRMAAREDRPARPELVILRATSVQGPTRGTTKRLAAFASSPLCSVAGDGSAHTPVTSIDALAEFTVTVGTHKDSVPQIVLLPWEGATAASILRDAGRRHPVKLPTALCKAAVATGYFLSGMAANRWHGAVRRIEVTWFGQNQVPGWGREQGLLPTPKIGELLRAVHAKRA
ncbi:MULTISPECIES: NAD-dependent epimerase/dehydratase family protein [Kocuria]|uniref:NAD-dependent epimerase/dehydratase family protein n=1 Tax=Kocuria subflava TaxID=1736139 RepID=A0A846TWG6_9MICC|nr:NAD-dependent epimerase/dehydratase family protein [Kocuria sp. CPCC 104605]NKE10092.1 NAD-dependent epimerase/dehydratase family protein [Kocuria subflava]